MAKKKSIYIKRKILLGIAFSLWILGILLLVLKFRELRNIFPPPKIEDDRIVGFAQYNGYPMYFDTIVFFSLIFSPVLILLAVYLFTKHSSKNNI